MPRSALSSHRLSRRLGGHMKDYEPRNTSFGRSCSEEGMSRSQMLRRSAAAASGLTVLSAPASALASRARLAGSTLPVNRSGALDERAVSEAKKEGHSTRSRCRRTGRTTARSSRRSRRSTGSSITNANPNGSSAEENQAISPSRAARAPRTSSTSAPPFAIQGAKQGLYAPYKNSQLGNDPGQP